MENKILVMKNITKKFPGVIALQDVNLEVTRGDIHAIVGENGAGKSTLMNVLSGLHPYGTYEGEFFYNKEKCKFESINDSENKGIVFIHQELALIPQLSIAENMFLGNEQGSLFNIDWDKTYVESENFLKKVGLNVSAKSLIQDLSVGQQQLVELAKALAKNVQLLILDEPTAALNDEDSENLLKLILDLKQQGITSILISHKLNEIEQVADTLTILRDGSTIETLKKGIDDISEPRIVKGMVGRELSDRFPNRSVDIGNEVLSVKNWTVYHPVLSKRKICDNINMNVREGEIVGISGLMGSGRTEFAMSLFGKSYGKNISGNLFIDGKEVVLNNVKDAINNGLAYVTEDRKGKGLLLDETIKHNISLTNLKSISKNSIIDADAEVEIAEEYRSKLNIRSTGIDQHINVLSGGNQQKVLLSKWLFIEPTILILDEPTRGIDVGAKYEIYTLINEMVEQKKSIILISSDMSELLGMCDRIYVMNQGRFVAEHENINLSQEMIMSSILRSDKGVL